MEAQSRGLAAATSLPFPLFDMRPINAQAQDILFQLSRSWRFRWAGDRPNLTPRDRYYRWHRSLIHEQLKDIPLIVVTARSTNMDVALGLHVTKVDDYVAKPFDPQKLLKSINKVLAMKEGSGELGTEATSDA